MCIYTCMYIVGLYCGYKEYKLAMYVKFAFQRAQFQTMTGTNFILKQTLDIFLQCVFRVHVVIFEITKDAYLSTKAKLL